MPTDSRQQSRNGRGGDGDAGDWLVIAERERLFKDDIEYFVL
jgi:hypothetical protein